MQIETADRERFVEAYKWYRWCCEETDRAAANLMWSSRPPERVDLQPGDDISSWDPDRAERIAVRQESIGLAHELMANALKRQAAALRKTTQIAGELLAKLEAQAGG